MLDSLASQVAAGFVVLAVGAALFAGRRDRRPGDFDGPHARNLVAQGAPLLDVRSAAEFASGHIRGAVNIPLPELETRIDELRKLQSNAGSESLVVYCRSGRRSGQARATLEARGFGSVVNLGRADIWNSAASEASSHGD